MSMAMIRPAPAIAAPLIAARPTPPQPITATVSPGRTLEVWITAPTPVITAAADQGGAVERHVLADRHAGVLVDQHLLGEGRQVQDTACIGAGRWVRRGSSSCSRLVSGR